MADSNQRKIADPIDLDEDDPFAELTRIMGFDPRKLASPEPKVLVGANNARPSVVASAASNATPVETWGKADAAPAADDDFGIDLEKELLGGFDDFDLPVEPYQQATPPAPAPALATPVQPLALAPAALAAAPAAAFTPAPADAASFDDIDWEPMEAELAAAAESVHRDHEVEQTRAEAIALPITAESDAIADDRMDDDLAAELDRHFAELQPPAVALGAEPATAGIAAWSTSGETNAAAGPLPVVQHPAEVAPAADDDLLEEFELPGFSLAEEDEQARDAVEAAMPPEAAVEDAGDGPAAAVAAHLPDKPEAGAAFADVDMDFSAALEAELDGTEAHAQALAVAGHAPPPVAVGHGAMPLAAPTTPDEPFELTLEDELGALLESEHAEPGHEQAEARTTVGAPSAAAADSPRGHFLSDPRWAALAAAHEDGAVNHGNRNWMERRPLGDASLTGRHANFQLPAEPAAESVDDLDDLLDAMEHEAHSDDHAPAPVAAAQPMRDTAVPVREEEPHVADYAAAEAAEADYDAVPEIETVDVPEAAVAVTDDLDLPDLVYEEDERQQAAAYDDIDADFAASFNQIATSEEPVSQAVRGTARPNERAHQDVDFSALYPATSPRAEAAPTEDIEFEPLSDEEQSALSAGFDDEPAVSAPDTRYVDLDFDADGDHDRVEPLAVYQPAEQPRRSRTLLILALVGGVALLGAAGAYAAYHYGAEKSGAPAVVKADAGPVKVKPENPGGAAVPNQDNKVYDAVKGATAAQPATPSQPKLVTTQEEPVDVASVDKAGAETPDALPGVGSTDLLPGVDQPASQPKPGMPEALPGVDDAANVVPKAEDRVDPVADADRDAPVDDNISVTPRKVRTMVVRSDGTLVPRDEPAAAAETETSAAVDDQPLPPANDQTGAVDASEGPSLQSPGAEPVPVKRVKSTKLNGEGKAEGDTVAPTAVHSTKVDAKGKPQAAPEPSTPPAAEDAAAQPVPQPAKAPQPADPVKPEEVAAANVDPTAIANGSWSVQIASQPSADSAKSTYQDLAQRYGSVLDGRGVNIVKADIEGKGTYWRVRVPAKSRNDAISLCNDYKAAGGNCFVSK